MKLAPVHYRGAAPAMNDVMGGHTNMMLVSVSSALPTASDQERLVLVLLANRSPSPAIVLEKRLGELPTVEVPPPAPIVPQPIPR